MVKRATTLVPEVDRERRARIAADLEVAFQAIRDDHDLPRSFPDDVLAEAEAAAEAPSLPDRDETDVAFLTVDPPGSMDLDQAMHLERTRTGFRVRYAIADVPAFVRPGGPIDQASHERGQTVYCPDVRVPLHPTALSEGAASLLPEAICPAYVWDVHLDADGQRTTAEVYRAMVRSRARFTYVEVQRHVDEGTGPESLQVLRDVGRRRIERESARGGASLPMPEQAVVMDEHGHYDLVFRPGTEADHWNAQISLLTGITAAELMLEGGIGILRTMPEPDERALATFRRQVDALGVSWPDSVAYGDFLRGLDPDDPRHLAVVHDATSLFRGAGYAAFDGEPPEVTVQAAIAAPYAHVTAPLRRLVDKYGLAVCEALCAGTEVPDWARRALEELPATMARSGQRARSVERDCTDAAEAAVLRHRIGQRFDAVVVDRTRHGTPVVQVLDPAVNALADGRADLGEAVSVELVVADVHRHRVRFRIDR